MSLLLTVLCINVAPQCPQASFQPPTFAKWELAKQTTEAALCALLPCTSSRGEGARNQQNWSHFLHTPFLSKAPFGCKPDALVAEQSVESFQLRVVHSCVDCRAHLFAGTSEVLWVMGMQRFLTQGCEQLALVSLKDSSPLAEHTP